MGIKINKEDASGSDETTGKIYNNASLKKTPFALPWEMNHKRGHKWDSQGPRGHTAHKLCSYIPLFLQEQKAGRKIKKDKDMCSFEIEEC